MKPEITSEDNQRQLEQSLQSQNTAPIFQAEDTENFTDSYDFYPDAGF